MLAETTPAAFVAFDLLALDDRVADRASPSPYAVSCSTQALDGVDARRPPHRGHHRPGSGPALVRPVRGRRTRRCRRQAAGLGATSPNARAMFKVKHERTADVVVAGYRLHKNSTADGRCSAPCCWGCTTTQGTCATWASPPRSPRPGGPSSSTELRPLTEATDDHPGGRGSEVDGERGPDPGRPAGGVPARTSRSFRCALSACWR